MAETLTPAQREAVENRGGKLLVSAAAGSGKTKVLVDRLMGYLMDPADPADLDEFLIITYTRAAASELRAKIAKKLNEHIAANPEDKHLQKQLQRLYLTEISTVHAHLRGPPLHPECGTGHRPPFRRREPLGGKTPGKRLLVLYLPLLRYPRPDPNPRLRPPGRGHPCDHVSSGGEAEHRGASAEGGGVRMVFQHFRRV